MGVALSKVLMLHRFDLVLHKNCDNGVKFFDIVFDEKKNKTKNTCIINIWLFSFRFWFFLGGGGGGIDVASL